MPYNDRSLEQICEYETVIGCLQGITDRHIECQFLFGGDLNVVKTVDSACNNFVNSFVIIIIYCGLTVTPIRTHIRMTFTYILYV